MKNKITDHILNKYMKDIQSSFYIDTEYTLKSEYLTLTSAL